MTHRYAYAVGRFILVGDYNARNINSTPEKAHRLAGDQIQDAEHQSIFMGDLKEGNWFEVASCTIRALVCNDLRNSNSLRSLS